MKAIRFILAFTIFFSFHAIAQIKKMPHKGIQFIDKDWNAILAMAKKEHKLVFVDAYAIWCAPCQEMKMSVFTDRSLASSFNQRFVNFMIDVEKKGGIEFAAHYQIDTYPTLLFINADGKLIKKIEGFIDARTLAEFAAEIR